MNPNDTIRSQILCWFYNRNNNGTSKYGKKGTSVKTSDVKSGLKKEYNLSQYEKTKSPKGVRIGDAKKTTG